MTDNRFLLYGANGYTAGLIIRFAGEYGLKPVLAGRNEAAIRSLAEQHGLDYRIASLDDPKQVDALLQGFQVVLHAAGPFMYT
ncbi:MAG: NAD(P)H-binding protein, partial [Chitinophagaceae bacterium]|nr:NAD(P)H-binding protein [Chitinophagaceae bacterium]